MNDLNIVLYSDIHWDKYSNGITMDDLDTVEDQIRQASIDRGHCPIIFGGDRFVDSNPLDEVKIRADAAMLRKCKDKIQQFYLVGNHDRWSRAVDSGHTFSHVSLYEEEYGEYVTVMEDRKFYSRYPRASSAEILNIFAIPAGGFAGKFEIPFTELMKGFYICLFHDIYKDSVVDARSGFRHSGTAHDIMDDERFSLVAGGDNHVPQDLGFNNTNGIHIGSTIQHNWGDAGSPRGFWTIQLRIGEDPICEFHESNSPRFVRKVFMVDDPNTFENWMMGQIGDVKNNIARIHIQGPAEKVTSIDRLSMERAIRSKLNPRKIQVVLEPWVKKLEFSDTIKVSTPALPHEDRWKDYVEAKGFAKSKDMLEIGQEFIEKARSINE